MSNLQPESRHSSQKNAGTNKLRLVAKLKSANLGLLTRNIAEMDQMISALKRIMFESLLIVLILSLTGCATLEMYGADTQQGERAKSDFYFKPVLSDQIVAIGKPDAQLASELHNDHVVALLGEKNTYLLFKGGEELEQISKLNLDSNFMDINTDKAHTLYLKGKQVWGDVTLTYSHGNVVSAEEHEDLDRAGFSEIKTDGRDSFQKLIKVEGAVYPALKMTDRQISKLTRIRTINLFNSPDAKPPVSDSINVNYVNLPLGVAIDSAMAPVYLGLGVVGLVAYPFTSNHDLPKPMKSDVLKDNHKIEYKIAHILVGSEDEAMSILPLLKQGNDFGTLAKEKSMDAGSGQIGGELGWTFLDIYPKSFAEAVLSLKKGEISKPVQTKYGWHIIKLENFRKVELNSDR